MDIMPRKRLVFDLIQKLTCKRLQDVKSTVVKTKQKNEVRLNTLVYKCRNKVLKLSYMYSFLFASCIFKLNKVKFSRRKTLVKHFPHQSLKIFTFRVKLSDSIFSC